MSTIDPPPTGADQRRPGTRQLQKHRTRQAILAAARDVIARNGLAAATTREIATTAGVATGTVFLHFPDLGSLVETLLDDHIADTLDRAEQTLAPPSDVVADLVHVARCLFDSYDREPDLSRQYLATSLFIAEPTGPAGQRLAQFREWVSDRIATAVADGAIPPVDATVAFTAYFSLYFGLLVAGLRGDVDRPTQVATLDAALRRLLTLRTTP